MQSSMATLATISDRASGLEGFIYSRVSFAVVPFSPFYLGVSLLEENSPVCDLVLKVLKNARFFGIAIGPAAGLFISKALWGPKLSGGSEVLNASQKADWIPEGSRT